MPFLLLSFDLGKSQSKGYCFTIGRLMAQHFCQQARFCACCLSVWAPGRAFAKSVGPWARFIQSVLSAPGVHRLLQRILIGACRLWLEPWAALCETGWAKGRIYKANVGAPLARESVAKNQPWRLQKLFKIGKIHF